LDQSDLIKVVRGYEITDEMKTWPPIKGERPPDQAFAQARNARLYNDDDKNSLFVVEAQGRVRKQPGLLFFWT